MNDEEIIKHWTYDEALKAKPHQDNVKILKGEGESEEWLGIAGGRDEVKRVSREGWPDGLQKARQIEREFGDLPMAKSFRRERVRGDHGDSLDIQRVYRGELDTAWERRKRRQVAGSGIGVSRILCAIGGTGEVDAGELFYGGAVACLLAEILETAGRPVELLAFNQATLGYRNKRGRADVTNIILLKRESDPLDMGKVIVPTALAGWFRHYVFIMRASLDTAWASVGATNNILPESEMQEGDIIIPRIGNIEEAKVFVKEKLAGFAVEAGALE